MRKQNFVDKHDVLFLKHKRCGLVHGNVLLMKTEIRKYHFLSWEIKKCVYKEYHDWKVNLLTTAQRSLRKASSSCSYPKVLTWNFVKACSRQKQQTE